MIGAWVQTERTRRGWSQAELADKVGITPQAVSLLERGKRANPGAQTLANLARAFGISLDELMRLAADPPASPAETLDRGRLDSWVKAIVALGPDLTPVQRIALLDHAEALRGQNKPRR